VSFVPDKILFKMVKMVPSVKDLTRKNIRDILSERGVQYKKSHSKQFLKNLLVSHLEKNGKDVNTWTWSTEVTEKHPAEEEAGDNKTAPESLDEKGDEQKGALKDNEEGGVENKEAKSVNEEDQKFDKIVVLPMAKQGQSKKEQRKEEEVFSKDAENKAVEDEKSPTEGKGEPSKNDNTVNEEKAEETDKEKALQLMSKNHEEGYAEEKPEETENGDQK
jgi:hypothetical protein